MFEIVDYMFSIHSLSFIIIFLLCKEIICVLQLVCNLDQPASYNF